MTRSFRWLKSRLARAGLAFAVLGLSVGCTPTRSNLANGRNTLPPPPKLNSTQSSNGTPSTATPAANSQTGANNAQNSGPSLSQAPNSNTGGLTPRAGNDPRQSVATMGGNQFQPASLNGPGSNSFSGVGVPTNPINPPAPINQANYQSSQAQNNSLSGGGGLTPINNMLPAQHQPAMPQVNPAITLPSTNNPPAPLSMGNSAQGWAPPGQTQPAPAAGSAPNNQLTLPGAPTNPATFEAPRALPVSVTTPAAPAIPQGQTLQPVSNTSSYALPAAPLDPLPALSNPTTTSSGVKEFNIPPSLRKSPPPMVPSSAADSSGITPAPFTVPTIDGPSAPPRN
jgi:hypothetical protein